MAEYEDKPNLADLDQALASMRDWTGPALRVLYRSLLKEGFTMEQAWTLTRDYCHGIAGGTRT